LTKLGIYTHCLGITRVRAKDSYLSVIYSICIADYSIFYDILKSALRGHVDLNPIRENFGDFTARLGRNLYFFFRDFRIQFKVKGVEMLS